MKYCRILFTPSHVKGVQFPLGILLQRGDGTVEALRASKYPSKDYLGPACHMLLKSLLQDFDEATALHSMCDCSPHAWAEDAAEVPPGVEDVEKWLRIQLP